MWFAKTGSWCWWNERHHLLDECIGDHPTNCPFHTELHPQFAVLAVPCSRNHSRLKLCLLRHFFRAFSHCIQVHWANLREFWEMGPGTFFGRSARIWKSWMITRQIWARKSVQGTKIRCCWKQCIWSLFILFAIWLLWSILYFYCQPIIEYFDEAVVENEEKFSLYHTSY